MRKRNFLTAINFAVPPPLRFLKRLTNQTGILQHTKYGVPHRMFGYSVDDNARALLAAVNYYQLYKKKECLDLAVTYLSFLVHAKRSDGLFYNFQTFDHKFLQETSEDAFGECIWALGNLISSDVSPNLKLAAKDLFSEVEKNIEKLSSPRAKAYSLLGLSQILKAEPANKQIRQLLEKLTRDLLALYERYHDRNWHWFEAYLTYANHILPAALFVSFQILGEKKILEVAERSLAFLEKETHTKEGIPSPIGSPGWFTKGDKKAIFDQQPVEAAYAAIANFAAFRATKQKKYHQAALEWFAWFHGNNLKKVKVYDEATGGCFDAVNEQGVNLNQGAESIICYLLAYLELARVYKES